MSIIITRTHLDSPSYHRILTTSITGWHPRIPTLDRSCRQDNFCILVVGGAKFFRRKIRFKEIGNHVRVCSIRCSPNIHNVIVRISTIDPVGSIGLQGNIIPVCLRFQKSTPAAFGIYNVSCTRQIAFHRCHPGGIRVNNGAIVLVCWSKVTNITITPKVLMPEFLCLGISQCHLIRLRTIRGRYFMTIVSPRHGPMKDLCQQFPIFTQAQIGDCKWIPLGRSFGYIP
mmetsp:Transcript_43906/g.105933  ORF Transcript_43906/g.105933 Transcript_43906/m.105933 type:complete len:228 (+) Transcript_43906:2139-2822(+)